ncbi:MAG: hypothetical protein R2873_18690 [Caldilineaceae bacterium]
MSKQLPLPKPQVREDLRVGALGFTEKIRQFAGTKDIASGFDIAVEERIAQALVPHPDGVKIVGQHRQLQIGATRSLTEKDFHRWLATIEQHLRTWIGKLHTDHKIAARERLDMLWFLAYLIKNGLQYII